MFKRITFIASLAILVSGISFADIPSPNLDACDRPSRKVGDTCKDSDGKDGTCETGDDGTLYCSAKDAPSAQPAADGTKNGCNNLGSSSTMAISLLSIGLGLFALLRFRRKQG